jgi:membrane-bound lytic murein transglycosylase D
MKIRHLIAAAVAAAFLTLGGGDTALAQTKKKNNVKLSAKKENIILRARIDSLKAELEARDIQDSLAMATAEAELHQAEERTENRFPAVYNTEVTDSLLTIWYLHNKVGEVDINEYNMDSVKFTSNVPDSVYIQRIQQMNSFITLPYNDIVRNYIILYSEKMPTKMGEILGLCNYYMPIFQEVFDRYDMPEELKAMAVIESALNPVAVSRAGAKGAWQFMYGTAKMYDLKIDSYVDERLDPVKSADAAARYMKDAYRIFGDWNLAIASYNCGAGNVNKAIRRSGGSRDFWKIYPYLPRETRGYVPAFVGALYAMNYYKEHNITPKVSPLPDHVDTIHVNKMLHFSQVNKVVGIPVSDLKNLNPQYKHQIIPGNEREYILRIPYQYTSTFVDKEDSLYTFKADSLFNPVTLKKIKDGADGERIVYKVKSGDYLGRIASRHRCTVAQIKRWNNLTSNNLRIGQRLVIYRGGSAPASSSSSAKKADGPAAKSSVPENAEYTIHTVKNGESLYLIAKQYPRVSAQNIMDFNKIGSNIKPGMKIKIPKL